MKAAVCRELGLPLVAKEVPQPQGSVLAEQRSCCRRRGGPNEGAVDFRLAAYTSSLPILESTKAGGVFLLELICHAFDWEDACASLPNGCDLGIEFNGEFDQCHEHSGDRLHLEMQDDPGFH